MSMQAQSFDDREIMNDALISQKFLTDDYNIFAGECSTPAVYNDFMTILAEEHQIQNEVFQEMSKRGWYQTQPAEQQKINETRTKFAVQNL